MIWINYILRGFIAIIVVSFFAFFMFLGAFIYAMVFNWERGLSALKDLPDELLDWAKVIVGVG